MRARRSPRGAAPASSGCRARSAPGRAHARAHRRGRLAHLRPAVHRELSRALPVQPARQGCTAGGLLRRPVGGVQVTDLDGNARYDLTGSYGVNLLGYDFYKGCMERGAAARRRARPGAGPLPVAGRRQCRAAGAHLRQGRGLVPHVGDGGGHAGRAARPLSHRPQPRSWSSAAPITAGGATCSRASAIRCRRTRPTRWPTCRSAPWPCCARGATSPACWSTPCRRCTPTAARRPIRPWSPAARTGASIAPPTRPG